MFANAKNSSDDIIIRLIMDINTTIQKKSLAEEVSSLIREQIHDGKLTMWWREITTNSKRKDFR